MKKNLAMLTLASVLFTSIAPLACATTSMPDLTEAQHQSQIAAQIKAADQRDAVMLTSVGAGYLSALAVAPISWTAFGVAATGGIVVVPALLAAAAYYELLSVPALPESMMDGSAFTAENLWNHKGEAALVFFSTAGVTTFGTAAALKLVALAGYAAVQQNAAVVVNNAQPAGAVPIQAAAQVLAKIDQILAIKPNAIAAAVDAYGANGVASQQAKNAMRRHFHAFLQYLVDNS